MINNLARIGEAAIMRSADVVVIGGGTAGLVLAERLSRRFRVIVLESGSLRPSSEADEANAVELIGDAYRAPKDGRTRALGGTSNIWGGAMLPFRAHDLAARPEWNLPAWAVSYEEVQSYFADVERLFGLAPGPYNVQIQDWLGPTSDGAPFIARYAKWPPHTRRNVAALLGKELAGPEGPEVWLEATCTEFGFSGHELRTVTATGAHGRKLTAEARHFVLAAGAIESTRLLRWALSHSAAPAIDTNAPLGNFLHDHVSAYVAEIETEDAAGLNRLAGFRFDGSTMRSFRLELEADTQKRLGMAGAFAHIAFTPREPSGFEGLRLFMRGLQAHRFDANALSRAFMDAPYLAAAAYWRLAYKQLLWPKPARYELRAVVEQLPAAANRISLSEKKDKLGVPLAKIEWRVGEFEKRSLLKLQDSLEAFWRGSRLAKLGRLQRIVGDVPDGQTIDVFHPGGTTRMGTTPRQSVVDSNLAVWKVPNLSVASTSTFPTGGGANPTMTLLALTLRLADFLERRLAEPIVVSTTTLADAAVV